MNAYYYQFIARFFPMPIICVLVMWLTGCATSKCAPGDTACLTAAHAQDIDQLAGDLQDVAQAGTAWAVAKDPTLRDPLTRAVNSLKVLETADTFTLNDVVVILKQAGIEQLDSADGQVYLAVGRIAFRRLGSIVDLLNIPEVKKIAGALRAGIEAGLGGIAPLGSATSFILQARAQSVRVDRAEDIAMAITLIETNTDFFKHQAEKQTQIAWLMK